MKKRIAFYGNSTRLGSFLLEKWCAKNHTKYKIFLVFNSNNESKSFTTIKDVVFLYKDNLNLIKLLNKNNIHNLFLLDPNLLLENSYLKNEFKSNGISIYVEDTDFLKTHFDKYFSNQQLKKIGIPIPKYCLLSNLENTFNLDFPLIIKPRRGYASKGVIIVENLTSLKKELKKIRDKSKFIVQEYIEGDEFSCTMTRKLNNKLNYLSIKRTDLKEYTIKSECKIKYNNHLLSHLSNLSKINFNYAINIQYKFSKKGAYIFELNPRLGTAETHRFEYNFDAIDLLLSKETNNKVKTIEGTYTQY